jgi:hypothetical protein
MAGVIGDRVIEVNETDQYKIVNHDIVEKQMDDQKGFEF